MNSKHNEGKSVVAKGFIRTLKNKISKYMTSVLKNVYIDKLDDIVNKYNNTYRNTIKMKPHILTLVKNLMIKILNLKLVKLLEYKNTKTFFAKGYTSNWSEEVFMIKNVKNTVPWISAINDFNGEDMVGTFHKN